MPAASVCHSGQRSHGWHGWTRIGSGGRSHTAGCAIGSSTGRDGQRGGSCSAWVRYRTRMNADSADDAAGSGTGYSAPTRPGSCEHVEGYAVPFAPRLSALVRVPPVCLSSHTPCRWSMPPLPSPEAAVLLVSPPSSPCGQAVEQVQDGQDGVTQEHARPGVAHHRPHTPAHVGPVTVHRTVGAGGLAGGEGAAREAPARIGEQLGALGAGRVVTRMVGATIEVYHGLDCPRFSCQSRTHRFPAIRMGVAYRRHQRAHLSLLRNRSHASNARPASWAEGGAGAYRATT